MGVEGARDLKRLINRWSMMRYVGRTPLTTEMISGMDLRFYLVVTAIPAPQKSGWAHTSDQSQRLFGCVWKIIPLCEW